MLCPNCGKKAVFDFTECKKCGWRANPEPTSPPKTSVTAESSDADASEATKETEDICEACGLKQGGRYSGEWQELLSINYDGHRMAQVSKYAVHKGSAILCDACIEKHRFGNGIAIDIGCGIPSVVFLLYIILTIKDNPNSPIAILLAVSGVGLYLYGRFNKNRGRENAIKELVSTVIGKRFRKK